MKRFLCLFLAICMVVLAVPAFMLSAVATPVAQEKVVSRYTDAQKNFTRDLYETTRNAAELSYDDYAAILQEKFKVDQGDYAWKIGALDEKTGAFTPFTRLAFFCNDHNVSGVDNTHDTTWGCTEEYYQIGLTTYLQTYAKTEDNDNKLISLWDKNIPIWQWGDQPKATARVTTTGGNAVAAYQYTVEADGVYGISVDNYVNPANNSRFVCLLVDGVMVWPKEGGSLSNTRDWQEIPSATDVSAVQAFLANAGGISVKKNQTMTFCFRSIGGDGATYEPVVTTYDVSKVSIVLTDNYGSNSQILTAAPGETVTLPAFAGNMIFLGWDSNDDGIADLADEGSFVVPESVLKMNLKALVVAPARFADNLPTYDSVNGVVNYYGSWTCGRFDLETQTYDTFVAGNGSQIWVDSLWGGTGGGLYLGDGKLALSGCLPDGKYVNQIQYTAQYNGTVDLDFSRLTANREVNPNNAADVIAYNLAIYKNGTKIWPTDTDWYSYVGTTVYTGLTGSENILETVRTAGNFPISAEVKMGDTFEFRVQSGNENSWMFFSQPTVVYTELSETPVLQSASVSVGTDLGLNFYVNTISARDNAVTGLYYWETEQSVYSVANAKKLEAVSKTGDVSRFTYRGLSAKQMSDLLYVMPYSSVEGGETVYGTVSSYSIAQYAESAMGKSTELDQFLIALVNYGTEAQHYFDYNTDNQANSFLSQNQKNSSAGTLKTVYAQSGTEGKIKNVSLVLDNQIGLKFMIDAKEGATSYKLQIADNEDFTGATEIDMTATEEGKEYKGITYVDFTSLSKTLYVRVSVDGTAGATLTYSVESYAQRLGAATTDDTFFYLLESMMVFGQVSAAQAAD